MFMHKTFMELKDQISNLHSQLNENIRLREKDKSDYEARIIAKDRELDWLKKKHSLEIDEAKQVLRKEMEKSLIESDLKRVKAESALETYKAMDTKEEREHIRNMLAKAIEGLSQKVEVNVKN